MLEDFRILILLLLRLHLSSGRTYTCAHDISFSTIESNDWSESKQEGEALDSFLYDYRDVNCYMATVS